MSQFKEIILLALLVAALFLEGCAQSHNDGTSMPAALTQLPPAIIYDCSASSEIISKNICQSSGWGDQTCTVSVAEAHSCLDAKTGESCEVYVYPSGEQTSTCLSIQLPIAL